MTRREARIAAMQILYTRDFNNVSIDEAISAICDEPFDDTVLEFVHNTEAKKEEIDVLISKSLVGYTLDRLNLVDKAIIRLATMELLAKTDKKIVINEALEITKEFSDQGDHKAVAFNNRLLDKIYQNIEE